MEHLLSGKRKKVHTTRVKFYRDASLEVTEELISFLEYQDSILFVVEELIALRQVGETVLVQVKWLGFDDLESTWEPVSTIAADVPEIAEELCEWTDRSAGGQSEDIFTLMGFLINWYPVWGGVNPLPEMSKPLRL
jgi:Chromo (CHRromatin Organisation MOdifier) domain